MADLYQDPCTKYKEVWNTENRPPPVDKIRENDSWYLANCIVDKLNSSAIYSAQYLTAFEAVAVAAKCEKKTASITVHLVFAGGTKEFPAGSALDDVVESETFGKRNKIISGAPIPSNFEFTTSEDGGVSEVARDSGKKAPSLRDIIEGTSNFAGKSLGDIKNPCPIQAIFSVG